MDGREKYSKRGLRCWTCYSVSKLTDSYVSKRMLHQECLPTYKEADVGSKKLEMRLLIW